MVEWEIGQVVDYSRALHNRHFAQFWSLRGAKRRGNLVDYQHVLRLLRFARNDNAGVFQRFLLDYSTTRLLDQLRS
jgi:hypothetical protein